MIGKRTECFLALERRLPQLCDSLGLDETQRSALHRYHTDALRPVMLGAYDWDQRSGRYSASYILLADAPGGGATC